MAIAKTPFINGVSLSYPLGVFPDLFAVLGTRTKRTFFEKMYQLEGKGGEGFSPDQIVNMFRIGLITDIPEITYKQAEEYVQDYLTEYGDEELGIKLVDAFVDAGLNNREIVEKERKKIQKRRELLDELEKIQEEKNSARLREAWAEVEELNAKLGKVSDELMESINSEDNESNENISKPVKRDPLDRKTKKK